jgi:uncharacterized membrane protein YqhA
MPGWSLVIAIFSGYENFVSGLDAEIETVGHRGFHWSKAETGPILMKLRNGEIADEAALKWSVIIHLTLVTSGVLLALMDLVSSRTLKH